MNAERECARDAGGEKWKNELARALANSPQKHDRYKSNLIIFFRPPPSHHSFGETDYRWVALDTWNFTRSFDAPPELLAHTAVDLVATGVDTVATVVVNGKVVAGLDNAHRRHRIALKDVLTPGRNDITFVFASAITEAIARNASSPYWIPALTEAQAAPFNMVRKPASDFGWDWGPAFAPAGLYGDVQLVGYSDAHLVGCNVRQQHDTEGAPPAADGKAGAAKVTLTFDAVLQALAPGEAGTLAISPSSPNASPAWTATGSVVAARAGANIVSLAIDLPAGSYEKWWPVGYGGQPLYTFDVVYTPATAPDAATALSRRIGVRTVDLVRDPIPVADVGGDGGETFFFRVNGVPVYAKGTNMIPIHIVASRTTASDLVGMVKASVAANMNMVRVWGGGLYPADAFYDACDEAGVLVWQEFMAACALYPRDPAFAEEVRKEVTYQARRLNHHASMAIWGGNNEIEASFGWFTPSRTNERLYVADYTALFVDVVRSAVRAVDAGVAFVDTSPSKGVIVNGAGDDYVKRWGDVADWRRGDVHFYTVTDDALNLTTFPRAKFVSEFGFQSFASWEAVKGDLAGPGDWSHNATAIEFRQRHPGNTASLNTQMARHYQVPAAWAPPGLGKAGAAAAQEGLFKAWIYLTQVYQAAAYETASGYWRRIKDEADAQTMGVLYWQLNDIWPVRNGGGGGERQRKRERERENTCGRANNGEGMDVANDAARTPPPSPPLPPLSSPSGLLLVLPRLWRRLEAAALLGQTLLRALPGERRRAGRRGRRVRHVRHQRPRRRQPAPGRHRPRRGRRLQARPHHHRAL